MVWGYNPSRRIINPLNRVEYRNRIRSAKAEIEEAAALLSMAPYRAEDHAYTALGILEHLPQEYLGDSKSDALRRRAQVIINEADVMQGRRIKTRVRNPLTPLEFQIRINSAEAHIQEAYARLDSDPHEAREHARQALGVLRHVEQEYRRIDSVQRGIVNSFRKMANIAIDEANRQERTK
jgi:hypothetical protein